MRMIDLSIKINLIKDAEYCLILQITLLLKDVRGRVFPVNSGFSF